MEGVATGPVRVMLVDDHELVRRGMQDFLENKRDISIVGECASAAEAVRAIPSKRPDVMLLDIHLPDGSGVTVCRQVRAAEPSVKGLMLTAERGGAALLCAVVAGAHGYVLKEARALHLADDIRHVAAGRSLIPELVVARVRSWLREQSEDRVRRTSAERKILDYVLATLAVRRTTLDPRMEAEVAQLLDRLPEEAPTWD